MKLALLIFTLFITGIASGQTITTVAGGATGHTGYWGEGGPATAAQLLNCAAVAVDKCGDIYIADALRILKVNASTGIISTYAGTGVMGYNGDGIPATDAQLNYATWIGFDHGGNLHIADGNNARIRKVDKLTGLIYTVAGNGIVATTGDGGPATSASIQIAGFDWDIEGNLYIGDLWSIRKVDPSGIISTYAGTGVWGPVGEGVPATSTCIAKLNRIRIDRHGNLFFGDSTASVRKIDKVTGLLHRISGTGDRIATPYSGDGTPATTCHHNPIGLWLDDTGNLYTADFSNHRVEKIDAFGIINTVVGTGIMGLSGDGGHPLSARLKYPQDVCFDMCGNMYIADFVNKRIRKVTYPGGHVITPTISLSGTSIASVGTSVTLSAAIDDAGCSYVVHWLNRGVEFATSTTPTVTYTKPTGTDTITARVVPNNVLGCYDSGVSVFHLVFDEALENKIKFKNGDITIYPNPAGNILYIDALQEEGSYTITTIVGAVAKAGAVQRGSNSISLAGVAPGIYLLQVQQLSGAKAVYKIVKE